MPPTFVNARARLIAINHAAGAEVDGLRAACVRMADAMGQ